MFPMEPKLRPTRGINIVAQTSKIRDLRILTSAVALEYSLSIPSESLSASIHLWKIFTR